MLLLLVACSDTGLSTATHHDGVGGADIVVDPLRLEFGQLGTGDVAIQTITISNEGEPNSELTLGGVAIAGAEGFEVLTEVAGMVIPAGASTTVDISFTPLGAKEQQAVAIVASDDEDEPQVEVTLVGEGATPELQIEPEPYDFGSRMIGCDTETDLTLENVGLDTLVIDSLDYEGYAMAMNHAAPLPITLAPGETTTATVTFHPYEEQEYRSVLTVGSNDPRGEVTAVQTGTGTYGGETTDIWDLADNPPVDIIFAVDQSGSMDDDQSSLANNFSKFITQLTTYTSDWHVIVANDDDGCNNSGVLTSTTSNYESRFESSVKKGGGIWTEALLTVTQQAVDKSDTGECNEKFIRPDAMLHIIVVSDEPEQSWGSWKDYVDEVIAKKGDASMVKYSAVAGPVPGGCHSGSNSAEAGSGYDDAVSFTGGEFLSICSDWSSSVKTLADASISMTTFTLSQTPDPDTIVVKKNGKTMSSYWMYESSTNAVIFPSDHAAESGDKVEVTYSVVASSCD